MLEVLIPSLLKNERLLSSRVYDVQKITDKAGRDENFANVFEAAQGGTVVLNLEGEKNIGQYATGYYKLAEKLGEKLLEYGNKVLFVLWIFRETAVSQTRRWQRSWRMRI